MNIVVSFITGTQPPLARSPFRMASGSSIDETPTLSQVDIHFVGPVEGHLGGLLSIVGPDVFVKQVRIARAFHLIERHL